jgi:hypothetical protein
MTFLAAGAVDRFVEDLVGYGIWSRVMNSFIMV